MKKLHYSLLKINFWERFGTYAELWAYREFAYFEMRIFVLNLF